MRENEEYSSSTCIVYINVDAITNIPSLTTWNGITVTDAVAEYLDYLKASGYVVTVLDTSSHEPRSGFHLYDTDFSVSGNNVTWRMYLGIEDELFTEYEFDIYTD